MRWARTGWGIIPAVLLVLILAGGIVYVLIGGDQLATPAPTPAPVANRQFYDWLQFNGDFQHSGNNTQETIITSTNVARLKKLFRVKLPGLVDGAPVYLANVARSSGPTNLLYASTTEGMVVAIEAGTGAVAWNIPQPAASGCIINSNNKPCYTTSQPALDPTRRYVYGYRLDGMIHRYAVSDGQEVAGKGWPALASRKPDQEKGSSDLGMAVIDSDTSYLYMTHAYYPDSPRHDQGHLTTINLQTGQQHVFNTACSDKTDQHFGRDDSDCATYENSIWARGPVVFDDDTNRLYFQTGCCTYDPANHHWGQSVLALAPDGSSKDGQPLDSYTMSDWQKLDEATQLASTAPAILPVPTTSKIRHLAAQAGKDGRIRLLNLDDLSGKGGPGNLGGEISGSYTELPQKAPVFTQPAVWVNPADSTSWLFVATTQNLVAYRLEINAQGQPNLHQQWQSPAGSTSSPLIAGGLLYFAQSGEIMALDPTSGEVRWRSNEIGPLHWESPIVANGVLYICDHNNNLTAFALDGKLP